MFIKKIATLLLMVLATLSAQENPFVNAGERYGVDPWLLYSIAKVESELKPSALNKNRNGTYDLGIMQINTIHRKTLEKYGISQESLWNPQININVGAWVLAGCIQRNGYTTKALDCYNGDKTGRYSKKVMKMLKKETQRYAQNY